MRKKCIDRKIGMVLSFRCCMKRNQKEVYALDANKIIFKIFEKSLHVDTAAELYKKISRNEEITIGDVLKLKELLNLTNVEAIDIFLSQRCLYMKTYRFKNAIIHVHGKVSKERLEKATIKLVKGSQRYKRGVKK